jgi:acyl-CoA synthetase (AMP-forming)/AMP-acid ligase II
MQVPLTVSDFLDRALTGFPDSIAIVDEPDQPAAPVPTTTYREFGERVRAWQAGLDALDVAPGARVAVVSHNSARLMELLHAVPGTGRICVPINFRLRPSEVQFIVDHSEADVLFVDPELDNDLRDVKPARHRFVLGEESESVLRFAVEPRPWAAPDENATATINYTSGTTASPKGVQLTHRNIWINAVTFAMHLRVWERDVLMHTLPMFHCNGWGMPYATVGLGAKNVVIRKIDGAEILRRVDAQGVTLMCGAPAVWAATLDAAAANTDGAFDPVPGRDRVRIVVAGAPPPSRTIQRIGDELGWEFTQIYGLTETAPLLTMNRLEAADDGKPAEDRARLLSRAGKPALGVRIDISDDGEVLARSNVVMDGYWRNPTATGDAIETREGASGLSEQWFHTGDGGSIDDHGYVTIADHKKDIIITGGENVNSIEVEDALFSHPAVAEVAIIGVPSEKWGETIKALVVLAPGESVTEAELIAHCKERLAGFKAPTSVEFRTEIPRTATGKIQKFKLREPYWAETGGRQVN